MRKRSRLIKYTGDPALIPIRSNESTVLVRILYQISARVNIMVTTKLKISLKTNSKSINDFLCSFPMKCLNFGNVKILSDEYRDKYLLRQ